MKEWEKDLFYGKIYRKDRMYEKAHRFYAVFRVSILIAIGLALLFFAIKSHSHTLDIEIRGPEWDKLERDYDRGEVERRGREALEREERQNGDIRDILDYAREFVS